MSFESQLCCQYRAMPAAKFSPVCPLRDREGFGRMTECFGIECDVSFGIHSTAAFVIAEKLIAENALTCEHCGNLVWCFEGIGAHGSQCCRCPYQAEGCPWIWDGGLPQPDQLYARRIAFQASRCAHLASCPYRKLKISAMMHAHQLARLTEKFGQSVRAVVGVKPFDLFDRENLLDEV
ncbi:unnamed protein product [Phaeothamnion confervicola]